MNSRWMVAWFCLLFLSPAGQASRKVEAPESQHLKSRGVIVEEVQEGSAAHKAGLEPGDLLLRWQRAASPPANPEPASGSIDSPFDLLEVEMEQAPRGELTVVGRRGNEPLRVRMPPGRWELRSRPRWGAGHLRIYEEARSLLARGELGRGLSLWKEMAAVLGERGDPVKASWLFFRVASAASERREWDAVDEAFEEAQRQAKASGRVLLLARVIASLARSLEERSDFEQASAANQEALELRQAFSTRSLGIAESLHYLGRAAKGRGDLASAEGFYRRSLAIRERLAPKSLDIARSLNNLGNVALDRGDLESAKDFYRRSLVIGKTTPQDLDSARTLNNLGVVTMIRGEMVLAEDLYRRSLAISEKLAPQGLDSARSLNNLGTVALARGDLASAEYFFRRALAIRERLAPGSLRVAGSLSDLGILARTRGNLASAEHYHLRSLAIRERLAPQGIDVATSLINLGNVASDHGDLASAEDFFRRALVINEELSPRSLGVAASLHNLGVLARFRGNLASAEDFFHRSLVLNEELAPHGTDVVLSLLNLGVVALDRGDVTSAQHYSRRSMALEGKRAPRGVLFSEILHTLGNAALASSDLETAEAHYERSLAIRRERAPGSALEAESCQRLATLHRRAGRLGPALGFYNCAVEALDAQRGKLGGSDEVRSGFGAKHAGTYLETIDLLVEMGRPEEAFDLLERYRARELLTLLAERDLVFSSDLPEEFDRERRLANASYDRAFGRWMKLSDQAAAEERKEARDELEGMRRRQDQIRAQIRAASPRLAALQYPQPLDLRATRAALDLGTLLLSYSIGEERSYLFAVGPQKGELRVFPLAIGEESLQNSVERFLKALRNGRFDRRPAKTRFHSMRLGELLLGPASDQIGQAKRLLILADGPLHSLPFAALADPGTKGEHRYLVEAKPVHRAASATVFARLKSERRERRATRLTAFGDPQYLPAGPRDEESTRQLRSVLRGNFDLVSLPATRSEVESLQRLYGEESEIYLGAEATEERAKSVHRKTTHLHIASHGLLDDEFPLSSALAFSIPSQQKEGQDNGLLQAWEIFEQVRIDADLVTLSACATGRGKVLGGEGLLGLTWAFQYAGARSVVASLWGVSDASTAELMKRFYGYLKEGQSKADALRSAQVDILRDPVFSHPFHWAGFELVGDWR